MSSDGSSSDSEVESDGEGALKQQITSLEETVSPIPRDYVIILNNATHFQLQASPYYYDGHTQLIALLRKQGDLEKAREARNNMRKIYPLSEGESG